MNSAQFMTTSKELLRHIATSLGESEATPIASIESNDDNPSGCTYRAALYYGRDCSSCIFFYSDNAEGTHRQVKTFLRGLDGVQ